MFAGALKKGPGGTFGTGPGNFEEVLIFEKGARTVNNRLGLSFLFFLLANA